MWHPYLDCSLIRLTMALAFLMCWMSQLPRAVQGFPSKVGSCAPGTGALFQPSPPDFQPHAELPRVGGGDLSDFNLELRLNGMTLNPNEPVDFNYNEDHTLSLVAAGGMDNRFTGFLMRLDAPDGARTVDALWPIETTNPETNMTSLGGVRIASECTAIFLIGGVSHDNNNMKEQVDVNLFMGELSTGMELDVTVVISASMNMSHWYFSRYMLNSIIPAPTTLPTDMPSAVPTGSISSNPTDAPAAVAATSSPSALPSTDPNIPLATPAPTPLPTPAPTPAPTLAPTPAPTLAPTPAPTSDSSSAVTAVGSTSSSFHCMLQRQNGLLNWLCKSLIMSSPVITVVLTLGLFG